MTSRRTFRSSLLESQDNESQDLQTPIVAGRSREHQTRPWKRRFNSWHTVGFRTTAVWPFQKTNLGNHRSSQREAGDSGAQIGSGVPYCPPYEGGPPRS